MADDTDVYGKKVSDLQNGVTVSGTDISGTLNYVTGYTGFNGSDASEQEGNYLALDFKSNPFPDNLTVELVGGTKGPVSLTKDDSFCVFLVKSTTQTIKVTATTGGKSVEKTYSLANLKLTPKPAPSPTLGELTVTVAPRSGGQTVTVAPETESGNMLRYKITAADAKPSFSYDTPLITADGWTAFPDNGQVSGTEGQVITVAEMTTQGAKARKKGEAVLPAPTK